MRVDVKKIEEALDRWPLVRRDLSAIVSSRMIEEVDEIIERIWEAIEPVEEEGSARDTTIRETMDDRLDALKVSLWAQQGHPFGDPPRDGGSGATARITKIGRLEVLRKGLWILQWCPFGSSSQNDVYCGHHCPAFNEDGSGNVTVCFGSAFHIIEDHRNEQE